MLIIRAAANRPDPEERRRDAKRSVSYGSSGRPQESAGQLAEQGGWPSAERASVRRTELGLYGLRILSKKHGAWSRERIFAPWLLVSS